MTTHFSMAPGMEPEWLFADLTDFYLFFLTLMGWLSESIYRAKDGDGTIQVVDWISLARSFNLLYSLTTMEGLSTFFCLRLVFG
jgi:hypothetical protein